MAACDACVLLRAPTMGETSGSAIRTLSLGKPLVVSDVGWFAELPDDVALKVPVGEGEVEALVAALRAARRARGRRAHGRGGARLRPRRARSRRTSPSSTSPRSSRRPGSSAVEAKILHAVAEAAADTGADPARLAPELAALGLASPNGQRPGVRHRDGLVLRHLADVGLARRALRRRGGRAARARPARRLAVDHGRRARLLRHGAELRATRATSSSAACTRTTAPSIRCCSRPRTRSSARSTDVYQWARVLNALVMCSVVFPAYLLARRVVRPGFALAAAALAVAIPSMVYVGTLMTENVVLSGLPLARVRARARARAADAQATAHRARALRARVRHARAGRRALRRGRSPRRSRSPGSSAAGRAGSARGSRPYALVAGRRRARRRRRGCARPLARADSRRLQRDDDRRVVSRLAGAALDPLPRRRARSLALRPAVRGADRARRERAPSRRRAPRVLRRGRVAHRVAHARGRRLRVALLAPHRGAQPLLRRAALPDRAARVDRARPAAARARGRRRRRRRGRAAGRDSRSSA